jgi:Uri superfamily endonuclease
MIDILERIDKHLINDDAEHRHWHADGLLEDAAMEIEKLRESLKKANAANSRLAQKQHLLSSTPSS